MRFGGIHSRTGGDLAPSLEALRKGIGAEWKLWALLAVTAWEDLSSRGGL